MFAGSDCSVLPSVASLGGGVLSGVMFGCRGPRLCVVRWDFPLISGARDYPLKEGLESH